jgi:hypothetical protein
MRNLHARQGEAVTQLSLIDTAPVAPAAPEWERIAGALGKLNTVHIHTSSGWAVHHCGHPTANFPYYILTPDGERIVAPNGRGFQRLQLAKEHVEQATRAQRREKKS